MRRDDVAKGFRPRGVQLRGTSPQNVIDQVLVLLTGQGGRTAPARQRGRSAPAGRSQPPERRDPFGVEGAGATRSRSDHGVVEHGLDDRGLPGQVQVGPRSA